MKNKTVLLLMASLWAVPLVSPLRAAQKQLLPGGVPDAALQVILKAIDDGTPYDGKMSNTIFRSLGRKGETLSIPQCKKVWELYKKYFNELAGEPRKPRKLQPGEGIPRKFDKTTMARAYLLFRLFERMPANQVKIVRAARFFPGDVSKTAKTVSRRKIEVNTSQTRWHSTGLYAVPGKLITVSAKGKKIIPGFKVRIGCHSDHTWQWYQTAQRRWPVISLNKEIKSPVTQVANPFGGLIYIEVPNNAPENLKLTFTIQGAVESPRFVYEKTSPEEWKAAIQDVSAPWAELECEKLVLTIPSELATQIDDPREILQFWQQIADAQDDLSGRTPPRYKERMVVDVDISAGYLHSGYPLMGHLDSGPHLINIKMLKEKGTWGWFHELGHNHQRRAWNKPGEVTVNIFSMYSMEHVVGLKTEEVDWYKKCITAANKFYQNGPSPDKAAWEDGTTLPLAMFIQLRKEFGWDFYKQVFRAYETAGQKKWPKTDPDRRDMWLVVTSKAAKRNLAPFYDRWGFSTSAAAKKEVDKLPEWAPTQY